MQSARGRLVVRDDDDDDLLEEVEERLRCCCCAVLTSCSLLFVVGKLLSVGLISSGGNGGKDAELISYAFSWPLEASIISSEISRFSSALTDKEEELC